MINVDIIGKMKSFVKKLASFLLFLVIGIVINLVLGVCVGTFFFFKNKELTDALGGFCFFEYVVWFSVGLGIIGWIISAIIMRKSLFRGLGFVFLPIEIIIFFFSILFAFSLFFWGYESLCMYNPLIDTEYSESFNPYNIPKLKVGMTRDEVVDLVGLPISESNNNMDYTGDGKCSFGDFAWYELYLKLENGKVVDITSWWVHD